MTIQLWPSSIWAQIESKVARSEVVASRPSDSLSAHLERTYWNTLRDVLEITHTTPARPSRSHKGRAA